MGWMGCKGADGLTFRFSFVRLLPDATTVTLAPGDALLIPAGWVHAVASAPATVAVNAWWWPARAGTGLPRDLSPRAVETR